MSIKGKIIIGLLIGAIVGIIAYLLNELNKINKAALGYAGFKIKSITLGQIDLTVYFKLINSGSLDMIVSNQEYDVFINGKIVSRIKYNNPITISPGLNILPQEVTIKLSDALRAGITNLSDFINDKSKINITMKGKRNIKIGFLSFKNLKVEETFNLGQINK